MEETGQSKKQHILVVSQYFYPEQFRINDICKEWVKRGYRVTVLTGIPNYPQGKFYSGYNWVKRRREEYEGIDVIRIPLIPRGHNSIGLILNYLSFVVFGFFWKLFTKVKADKVFIFEVSPMTQALVGVWFAKRRRIPCYIYVQDLWPENVEIITGIHNRIFISFINKMVDYIYKNCCKIFATSPSFVRRIEERRSAYAEENLLNGKKHYRSKVVFLPQYAEEFYKPVLREDARKNVSLSEVPEDGRFRIVFTGNIGYAQGLDCLPKFALELKNQGVRCTFYIIGDGRYKSEFENEIERLEVQELFRILGRKKPEEIPNYMALMDMAFLSFADNPLFEMTIPAKLQSYLACAMPILAIAGGETERIIKEAKCGYIYGFKQMDEAVNAVKELIDRTYMDIEQKEMQTMGGNALEYSRKNYDREEWLKKIKEYL